MDKNMDQILGNTLTLMTMDARLKDSSISSEIEIARRYQSVLQEELKNTTLAIKKVEDGESGVPNNELAGTLGWLVAERNHLERELRKNYAALFREYRYDKHALRNMVVGYYVNDYGFATTPDGKHIGEQWPGQFLEEAPEKLYSYDCSLKIMPTRSESKVICEIERNNIPAIKELLANFDMPLRDQINLLYDTLSRKSSHLLHQCQDVIQATLAHLNKNQGWSKPWDDEKKPRR